MNNRPLSTDAVTDGEPLITVNPLLTMKPCQLNVPAGEFDSEEIYGRSMQEVTTAEKFWAV